MRQPARLQLRLITCHIGGVIAVALAMPYFLMAGLYVRNLVLAWVLGVVLFLVFAIVAGVAWRHSLMARPTRWAIAAPAAVAGAIYLLLGSLSGFESPDAQIAMEASFVGGLCALFSSGFFLLWTWIAPAAPSGEQKGSE